MGSLVHVAVGVIRRADGSVLIARRSAKQHQGGLWEFPGGKVEPGEAVYSALCRELYEELGIQVLGAEPLLKISHKYTDKSVLLDVWCVQAFSGNPVGREQQPLQWVSESSLCEYDFPDANKSIVSALTLPHLVFVADNDCVPEVFRSRLASALSAGAKMVYMREGASFDRADFQLYYQLCRAAGADVVTNNMVLAREFDVGLHLKSSSLDSYCSDELAGFRVVGAACHSECDIKKAKSLNLSYAFLSPVRNTQSHSGAVSLGVEGFSRIVCEVGLPVYALGGMRPSDVALVRRLGGQGVACKSALW